MNLPIYKIVLGDTDGIEKMSLVEYPAVERNFLAFSKDEKPLKFSIQDEYQHIVMGCALRANYPIYRNQNGFEFYAVFTPEDINTLYQKFTIDEKINDVNLEHSKDYDDSFDFLIYMFISFFKRALRQGLFKQYKLIKHNDSNVKGTIDINRYIKNNIPFNGKISYNTREYSFIF